jgi:hypothetical protein
MDNDKKEVKRLILGRFRALDPGGDYVLPRRWVEDYCLRKTEPAARPVVQEAVGDLVAIGILAEIHQGMGRLALTDLGAKLILRD